MIFGLNEIFATLHASRLKFGKNIVTKQHIQLFELSKLN